VTSISCRVHNLQLPVCTVFYLFIFYFIFYFLIFTDKYPWSIFVDAAVLVEGREALQKPQKLNWSEKKLNKHCLLSFKSHLIDSAKRSSFTFWTVKLSVNFSLIHSEQLYLFISTEFTGGSKSLKLLHHCSRTALTLFTFDNAFSKKRSTSSTCEASIHRSWSFWLGLSWQHS